MATSLIHDRGRGPELVGTRITVYNLLPDFLDSNTTEDYICRVYELSREQVAAARAYILNNPEEVLARHLEIEKRIAVGNPPELIERMKKSHETFVRFKEWLAERDAELSRERAEERSSEGRSRLPADFPTFREWIEQQESRPAGAS